MLYCGDCFDILKTLPDKSIDLVLTDPPFNLTDLEWDKGIDLELLWQELKRVGKERTPYLIHCIQPFTTALVNSNPKWFRFCFIWVKNRSTGWFDANKRPLRTHEDIAVFYSKLPLYNPQFSYKPNQKEHTHHCTNNHHPYSQKTFKIPYTYRADGRRFPTTVLNYPCEEKERGLHNCQKPIALLEHLIKTYSNEGDSVLDCFMGSGSTGVACHNTGRQFIGIEKEQKYFDIASDRLEKL